jgi:prepilin-type N-terminal cleavage/methylation domain-containing protein
MATNRNDNQAGFTLVELLVGMAMSLIVVLAAVAMFTSTLHTEPKETATADVIGTARNAVEKLTTDLREGEKAALFSSSSLVLTTPCSDSGSSAEGSCEIFYQCQPEIVRPTFECVRQGDGPPETIVTGLASDEVFCVFPTPTPGKECGSQEPGSENEPGYVEREPRYVGITLEFPNHKEAEGTTILEDGAALHNRGLQGLVPQQ